MTAIFPRRFRVIRAYPPRRRRAAARDFRCWTRGSGRSEGLLLLRGKTIVAPGAVHLVAMAAGGGCETGIVSLVALDRPDEIGFRELRRLDPARLRDGAYVLDLHSLRPSVDRVFFTVAVTAVPRARRPVAPLRVYIRRQPA